MKKNNELLAGLGIIGLCALCCTIPLFIGGTATVGLSTFLLKPIWIVVLAATLISLGVHIFRKKSQHCTTCSTKGNCSCNSR